MTSEAAEFPSALLGPAGPVKISVFGSLRIWRGEHEADVGAPRNRIVLAEILAGAGRAVSVTSIIEAVWGDNPPASAVNQIHRIVGQLRRTLEPGLSPHASGRMVLAEGRGYRLAVAREYCDLFQFRDVARQADSALRAGDTAMATRGYAQALDLAQGALFGGLDAGVIDRPEFVAIEQERIAVAIAAADLAILHEAPLATVASVVRIAASAPLNEPLHARLMRLLAKGGRRSDAIALFDAMRHRLADELGLNPGPELNRAFRDLMAADAATAPF